MGMRTNVNKQHNYDMIKVAYQSSYWIDVCIAQQTLTMDKLLFCEMLDSVQMDLFSLELTV
jgi:hypothetical protein